MTLPKDVTPEMRAYLHALCSELSVADERYHLVSRCDKRGSEIEAVARAGEVMGLRRALAIALGVDPGKESERGARPLSITSSGATSAARSWSGRCRRGRGCATAG